jgi:hypothetical protein
MVRAVEFEDDSEGFRAVVMRPRSGCLFAARLVLANLLLEPRDIRFALLELCIRERREQLIERFVRKVGHFSSHGKSMSNLEASIM